MMVHPPPPASGRRRTGDRNATGENRGGSTRNGPMSPPPPPVTTTTTTRERQGCVASLLSSPLPFSSCALPSSTTTTRPPKTDTSCRHRPLIRAEGEGDDRRSRRQRCASPARKPPPSSSTSRITTTASKSKTLSHHSSMTTFHLVFLAMFLLSFRTIVPVRAGLSVGGGANTAKCYESLDAASGNDNRVDRDEYVDFVSFYSDDAFDHFDRFEFLPTKLIHNFNSLACGCDNCSCDSAYLLTSGTGEGESPTGQEQLYLYPVCVQTKLAIDVSLSPPPDGNRHTGLLPMAFSYQLQASDASVTADEFFAPENFLRSDLLMATSQMMDGLVTGLFPVTGNTRRRTKTITRRNVRGALQGGGGGGAVVSVTVSLPIDGGRGGSARAGRAQRRNGGGVVSRRRLDVYFLPDSPEIMDVRDVECPVSTDPATPPPANCLEIFTNVTLSVADENADVVLSELLDGVDRSIDDGTFEGFLPSRSAFLTSDIVSAAAPPPPPTPLPTTSAWPSVAIYSPTYFPFPYPTFNPTLFPTTNTKSPVAPTMSPTTTVRPTVAAPPTVPPTTTGRPTVSANPSLLIGTENGVGEGGESEKKSTNIAGIASGVSIAAVILIVALFILRRKRKQKSFAVLKAGDDKTPEFTDVNSEDLEKPDPYHEGDGSGNGSEGGNHSSGVKGSWNRLKKATSSRGLTSKRERRQGQATPAAVPASPVSSSDDSSSGSGSSGSWVSSSSESETESEYESESHGTSTSEYSGSHSTSTSGSYATESSRSGSGSRAGVSTSLHSSKSSSQDDAFSGRSESTSIAEDESAGFEPAPTPLSMQIPNAVHAEAGAEDDEAAVAMAAEGTASGRNLRSLSNGQSRGQDKRRQQRDEDDDGDLNDGNVGGHVGSNDDDDDSSSEGSSGWESSDGESSSANTGSVESFDPRLSNLGSSTVSGDLTSSGDANRNSIDEAFDELYDESTMLPPINPAMNPAVQREATMIPLNDEDSEEEERDDDSDDEESGTDENIDRTPTGEDIRVAIEKGDWKAVGATAAILASDSDSNSFQSSAHMSRSERSGQSSNASSITEMRAAEIDQLVETGNWDGIVAVASRYAEDASIHSSAQSMSDRGGGDEGIEESSEESMMSASVETADASSYDDVTSQTNSHTYSADSDTYSGSGLSVMEEGTNSTTTGTSSGSQTGASGAGDTRIATSFAADTRGENLRMSVSSFTNSFESKGGLTSSILTSLSSSEEKQQMDAYRAEVEALVRRVVPDEIDNIDDIMVQFSGREEELIETLRGMQEKSIAQRAHAAVQRSAKEEARRSGGHHMSNADDSSEDPSTIKDALSDYNSDRPEAISSRQGHYIGGGDSSMVSMDEITDSKSGAHESNLSHSLTRSFDNSRGSFFESDDESRSISSRSSRYSSTSGSETNSYSQSETTDFSQNETAEYSQSEATSVSSVTEEYSKVNPQLQRAIDAGDWRAVGDVAVSLTGSRDSKTNFSGGTSIPSNSRGSTYSAKNSKASMMSKEESERMDSMIDQGDWSGIIDTANNLTKQ